MCFIHWFYTLEWEHNRRNGFGTHYDINGDIYVGSWGDDGRTGKGTIFRANGNILQGYFTSDVAHGPCVYYNPEKQRKLVGEWFEGTPKCGEYLDYPGPFPTLEDEQAHPERILEDEADGAPGSMDPVAEVDEAEGGGAAAGAPHMPSPTERAQAGLPPPLPKLLLEDPDAVLAQAQREARISYLQQKYPELDAEAVVAALERGESFESATGITDGSNTPSHRTSPAGTRVSTRSYGGRSSAATDVTSHKTQTRGRGRGTRRKVPDSTSWADMSIRFEGEGVTKLLPETNSRTIYTKFGPL